MRFVTFLIVLLVSISSYAAKTIIKADELKVGKYSLAYADDTTGWTDGGAITITGTTSNPTKGTLARDKVYYKRNGSNLDVRMEYGQTAGSGGAGSGDYLFAIPSASGCTIDTAKVTAYSTLANNATLANNVGSFAGGVNAGQSQVGVVIVYDSTKVRFLGNSTADNVNYFVSSSSMPLTTQAYYTASFSVPCVGWSSGLVVRADQSNYDWTAYTPTFTGFGTVTSTSCYHKRNGPNLFIRCKYTTGTHTATEARVSLPSGLTSSSSIPTLIKVGELGFQTTSAGVGQILSEPSVTYLTYGFQSGANTGLTKINGNTLASTVTHNFDAIVPIQGWTENQSAPMITGIVTSTSTAQEKLERAYIANTGTPTVSSSSGFISSITDNGTGDFTVNFVAGTFSSAPVCTCSAYATNVQARILCTIDKDTAISSSLVRILTEDANTATDTDRDVMLICVGPR